MSFLIVNNKYLLPQLYADCIITKSQIENMTWIAANNIIGKGEWNGLQYYETNTQWFLSEERLMLGTALCYDYTRYVDLCIVMNKAQTHYFELGKEARWTPNGVDIKNLQPSPSFTDFNKGLWTYRTERTDKPTPGDILIASDRKYNYWGRPTPMEIILRIP